MSTHNILVCTEQKLHGSEDNETDRHGPAEVDECVERSGLGY